MNALNYKWVLVCSAHFSNIRNVRDAFVTLKFRLCTNVLRRISAQNGNINEVCFILFYHHVA